MYEVEGIGQKLGGAIINLCFDGTLKSLKHAYRNVKGIRQQKQWAISNWVNTTEKQLPDLLRQDFSNKETIIKEYELKINNIKNEYNKAKDRLNNFLEIRKIASPEENRLSKVRVSHFIKAYKNKKEASLLVNEHIKGVFPEWSPIPDWFKILISEGVV